MESTINIEQIGTFTIAILIFMSTGRMILFNHRMGIPITNYIKFSNIISYVLDIIYGLTFFIVLTSLIILLSPALSQWNMKIFCPWHLIVISFILVALGRNIGQHYWYLDLPHQGLGLKIKIYFEVCLFGLLIRDIFIWQGITFNNSLTLIYLLVFIFIYLITKINSRTENLIVENARNNSAIIEFKSNPGGNMTFHSSQFVFNNTADFVFLYDRKNRKYSVYPMTEIYSITMENILVPKYLKNEPVNFGKFWVWLFKPRR